MSYDDNQDDCQGEQDRTQTGRFVAGHKVLSPGAPKGVSKSELIRGLLEPNREKACARLVELANAGDPAAMKLYFQYLAPPAKPESEMVKVPGLKNAVTMADKAFAVLGAVAEGQISAEAGNNLLRMLNTYMGAISMTEMQQRLAALEASRAAPRPVSFDGDTGNLIDNPTLPDLA
jgi:hypothetical protein